MYNPHETYMARLEERNGDIVHFLGFHKYKRKYVNSEGNTVYVYEEKEKKQKPTKIKPNLINKYVTGSYYKNMSNAYKYDSQHDWTKKGAIEDRKKSNEYLDKYNHSSLFGIANTKMKDLKRGAFRASTILKGKKYVLGRIGDTLNRSIDNLKESAKSTLDKGRSKISDFWNKNITGRYYVDQANEHMNKAKQYLDRHNNVKRDVVWTPEGGKILNKKDIKSSQAYNYNMSRREEKLAGKYANDYRNKSLRGKLGKIF